MPISPDHAYIAVRPHDGFVDGACFTESPDAQAWCREMAAAGFCVQVCGRREAKGVLFTNILPPHQTVAMGLPVGAYLDRPIPGWIETADGVRWQYAGICGPQPDLDALPPRTCVIAPGLMYRAAGKE